MPIFEVEHNGQVYEVDAPDIQQAAQAAQAFAPPKPAAMHDAVPMPAAPGAAPQGLPEKGFWESVFGAVADDPIVQMWTDGLKKLVMGAPEAAGTIINNAGVMADAGFAGILNSPLDSNRAADITNAILERDLYQPRGDSAKQIVEGLGELFTPLADAKRAAGEATLEATGSPGLATAVDIAPDVGLTLLGGPKAVPGAPAAAEVPKVVKTGLPTSVEDLRAGGVKLRPSDVRALTPDRKTKVPGEFRERFADAPQLKTDMTLDNQVTLTKHAADELGVPNLTDESLRTAEQPHLATYQLAEDVIAGAEDLTPGFQRVMREALDATKTELPRGQKPTVLRVLSTLRDKARRFMKADNQEANNQGYAARNLADALEEEFGKQLEAVGEPQLLQQYQDARRSLAKIYDVWESKRADQIDAAALKRLNDKYGGERLKGRLKFIADASEYAPNVTGHSLKTASRAGGEIESSKEGITKSVAKAAIRKIPGMDVGKAKFQEKFGLENPNAVTYTDEPFTPAPRPDPKQGDLDLRETLQLDAPGMIDPRPPRRDMGAQADAFPPEFDLAPPPGRATTAPQTVARDLGEVMVDGESLMNPPPATDLADVLGLSESLVKPAGRVGKPKRRK